MTTRRLVAVACAVAPALARAGVGGLGVVPDRVDFGTVTVGVPSEPATIVVRNGGAAAIALGDVTWDGDGVTVDRRGLDHDLAPGESTDFAVMFVAAATGPQSGHVYLRLRGMDAPAAVVLVTATAEPGIADVHTVGCSVGPPLPSSWWLLPAAVAVLALGLVLRRRGGGER